MDGCQQAAGCTEHDDLARSVQHQSHRVRSRGRNSCSMLAGWRALKDMVRPKRRQRRSGSNIKVPMQHGMMVDPVSSPDCEQCGTSASRATDSVWEATIPFMLAMSPLASVPELPPAAAAKRRDMLTPLYPASRLTLRDIQLNVQPRRSLDLAHAHTSDVMNAVLAASMMSKLDPQMSVSNLFGARMGIQAAADMFASTSDWSVRQDFQRGGLLGAGRHAQVFAAIECKTGREVALKCIGKGKLLDTAIRRSALLLQTLAPRCHSLTHSNIGPV